MANSLIDDMYSESSNWGNKGNKNNSKKTLLIIILFLVIAAVIIIAMMLMKNINKPKVVASKNEFITYLNQGISTEFINTDTVKNVFETLKNNSSEANSDITISTNIAEIEEIANYKVQINTKYDSDNSRGLVDINLDYLDNSIFDLQALITGKCFGIKSDEIVTKYVGYRYENLLNAVSDTATSFSKSDEDSSDMSSGTIDSTISLLEAFDYKAILNSMTPEFLQSELDRYIQVLNNIDESKFSQKEVALKRETGNINATAYVLTLNQDDINSVLLAFLEELKYDTELISIVVQAFEDTGLGIDESSIQSIIDQIIASYSESPEDTEETAETYMLTIYISESQVLKVTLENSIMSCDIDYIFDSNSKTTALTILDKETSSGVKVDFYNISNDVSEEFGVDINSIEESEVVSKVSLGMLLTGITSQTNMSININLTYTDTVNEVNVNINTDVEFKDVELEDLTSDTCLFLDDLTEEERTMVMDSIEQRASEVLLEKQNQLSLINSNTGSSIIEGQPNSQEDDDAQKKEEAKEKLINAVANEMYMAEQNGEEYTVNDIADLKMEDATLDISVVDDVATVVIDGYTFTINAAFELSE